MKNIQKLKQLIKDKAQAIRETRIRLKEEQRNGSGYKAATMQIGLLHLKLDYRHHHIAYCELRGRTREQIERHTREDTPALNENQINSIKEAYAWEAEIEEVQVA